MMLEFGLTESPRFQPLFYNFEYSYILHKKNRKLNLLLSYLKDQMTTFYIICLIMFLFIIFLVFVFFDLGLRLNRVKDDNY